MNPIKVTRIIFYLLQNVNFNHSIKVHRNILTKYCGLQFELFSAAEHLQRTVDDPGRCDRDDGGKLLFP